MAKTDTKPAKPAKPTKGKGEGEGEGDGKPAAKKTRKATSEPVDLAAEEKALIAKYPDRNIIKGSIKDARTIREFGNKRTVEIRCTGAGETGKGCKTIRRVATSDLHQVSMCPNCIRQVRLDRRKEARAAKRPTKGSPKPKAQPPTKPAATTKPAPKPAPKPAAKPAATATQPAATRPPKTKPAAPKPKKGNGKERRKPGPKPIRDKVTQPATATNGGHSPQSEEPAAQEIQETGAIHQAQDDSAADDSGHTEPSNPEPAPAPSASDDYLEQQLRNTDG